jgi:hypothetical protein
MIPARRKQIADEERAAPVTILDALGRVIRVVPAEEFRRVHGVPAPVSTDTRRRRKESVEMSAIEEAVA